MDLEGASTRFEGALQEQAAVAAGDQSVEAAADALLRAMGPAIRQLAFDVAEAAVNEVRAQLPDYECDVVLEQGEPRIRVRQATGEPVFSAESPEARITLRLPDALKGLVEEAAGVDGDSVNTWVVKTLSSRARKGRAGRRYEGTIDL